MKPPPEDERCQWEGCNNHVDETDGQLYQHEDDVKELWVCSYCYTEFVWWVMGSEFSDCRETKKVGENNE